MAKKKAASAGSPAVSGSDAADRRRWEVEDALRTLQRAGEIVHDKKLMAEVKAMANEKADEMRDVALQASSLAKMGRISPKQMAKLSSR